MTGPPGIGKTTLVRRVVERLHGKRLTGFYTEELRGRGGRTGFRIVALDGREARLATVGGGGGPRVGRYTVDVAALEAVFEVLRPGPGVDAVVIDEIGKMECLSEAFVRAARERSRETCRCSGRWRSRAEASSRRRSGCPGWR